MTVHLRVSKSQGLLETSTTQFPMGALLTFTIPASDAVHPGDFVAFIMRPSYEATRNYHLASSSFSVHPDKPKLLTTTFTLPSFIIDDGTIPEGSPDIQHPAKDGADPIRPYPARMLIGRYHQGTRVTLALSPTIYLIPAFIDTTSLGPLPTTPPNAMYVQSDDGRLYKLGVVQLGEYGPTLTILQEPSNP